MGNPGRELRGQRVAAAARRVLLLAGVGCTLLLLAGCGQSEGGQSTLHGESDQTRKIAHLWWGMLAASGVVLAGALVMLAIAYRRRKREGLPVIGRNEAASSGLSTDRSEAAVRITSAVYPRSLRNMDTRAAGLGLTAVRGGVRVSIWRGLLRKPLASEPPASCPRWRLFAFPGRRSTRQRQSSDVSTESQCFYQKFLGSTSLPSRSVV